LAAPGAGQLTFWSTSDKSSTDHTTEPSGAITFAETPVLPPPPLGEMVPPVMRSCLPEVVPSAELRSQQLPTLG
jgi:hypothetical protein